MYVYIVCAGYMYNPLNILNAYDNINKAKNFCKEEYGININDWTFDEKRQYCFYDPEKRKTLKTNYDVFEIVIRNVQ